MKPLNLKTALRNLNKNKYLSFLNFAGLSTGLAVAINAAVKNPVETLRHE